MSYSVLFVDDEPNVLNAYKRNLRKDFDISTAESGADALELMKHKQGEFAVVVSDMQMPNMNGVEFLSQAKELSPHTVRMMLTGNADQQTAIDAINRGDIYRFINKPCAPEDMATSLNAAIGQYKLITAEKELLEQTLKGSIVALNEALALSNPKIFGRSCRIRSHVVNCVNMLGVKDIWLYESIAMLSLIGCVSLEDTLVDKVFAGQTLNEDEEARYSKQAHIGANLLQKIPRMEEVSLALKYQHKNFDGSGYPNDEISGKNIPAGARILKVVSDFDRFEEMFESADIASSKLQEARGIYDPQILELFGRALAEARARKPISISVSALEPGMTIAEDITTGDETLLMCKGQEVTPSVVNRLLNFWENDAIGEMVLVFEAEE
jgi:response regulator RpfG family c-di-GMP phosphodiesterase